MLCASWKVKLRPRKNTPDLPWSFAILVISSSDSISPSDMSMAISFIFPICFCIRCLTFADETKKGDTITASPCPIRNPIRLRERLDVLLHGIVQGLRPQLQS